MRNMMTGALGLLMVFFIGSAKANDLKTIKEALGDISISGQWFFAYVNEEHRDDSSSNEFRLKRGYLTFKRKLSDRFSIRVTQDIAVDKEGDGRGNIEIRLKYGYLRMNMDDLGIFTDPLIEGGVVHRPWLDFEQKINRYRVQGKMYLERVDMANSADYGVTFMSLLGGKLDKEGQARSGKKYPGRYGSLAFGIYNGGGYDKLEENKDKLIEARLSLRPFPDALPGFQLHTAFGTGAGNAISEPDFELQSVSLSFVEPYLTSMITAFSGTGNQDGDALGDDGKSIDQNGWSVFAEITPPAWQNIHLFGRYDLLENDLADDWARRTKILGLSWHVRKDTMLMLDWQTDQRDGSGDEVITELAVEFKF